MLTREQREFLVRSAAERAKLERDLQPIREKHQKAVLAAEARFAEAMHDAQRFTYPTGDGQVIFGYMWCALYARADRRLSDELAAADRAFNKAAAPFLAQYESATRDMGSASTAS